MRKCSTQNGRKAQRLLAFVTDILYDDEEMNQAGFYGNSRKQYNQKQHH